MATKIGSSSSARVVKKTASGSPLKNTAQSGSSRETPGRKGVSQARTRPAPQAADAGKKSAGASAKISAVIKAPGKAASSPVLTAPAAEPLVIVRGKGWDEQWAGREKQYAQIFGSSTPKGQALSLDGQPLPPADASRQGLCVMQYAPRAQRMSWLYVTHGLSQCVVKSSSKKAGQEIVLHWKQRETASAVKVLSQIARHVLNDKGALQPGDFVSAGESMDFKDAGYQHWLACPVDKALAGRMLECNASTDLLALVGISEAEMLCALKVSPEQADGRQVLFQSLVAGGIHPMTDPLRTCLTRRRDFNRIWESSFRAVREQNAAK
jgi:hypothetical protein